MGPLGPRRLVRGLWFVAFGSWPLLRTGNCLEVMVTVGNCPSMMLVTVYGWNPRCFIHPKFSLQVKELHVNVVHLYMFMCTCITPTTAKLLCYPDKFKPALITHYTY